MAFLFKSKKHQDRALGSRDGTGSAMGGAPGRVRDEKGTRSTPTGSLNSLDIDGSVGSPEQNYGRTRGQSLEQQSQPAAMLQQSQQQQPSSDLPVSLFLCIWGPFCRLRGV